jgi:hypothetical protein
MLSIIFFNSASVSSSFIISSFRYFTFLSVSLSLVLSLATLYVFPSFSLSFVLYAYLAACLCLIYLLILYPFDSLYLFLVCYQCK